MAKSFSSLLYQRRERGSSIPVIAVSAELAPDRMRNLVRINASDWLRKPLDGKELLNAVTFHDSGSHASRSSVVTFISASGGAGATTLALSAAKHLSDKSAQHAAGTCLVDLDFQNANCGGYLNLFNHFDIEGIVAQPDRLDVELMDVIKLTREPGFTIYSFERPSLPFEPMGRDFVLKLLDLIAYRFENVIVDLPNLDTPWHSSVLSTSDEIFVVFELNVASLRQAKRLYSRKGQRSQRHARRQQTQAQTVRKPFLARRTREDLQGSQHQGGGLRPSVDVGRPEPGHAAGGDQWARQVQPRPQADIRGTHQCFLARMLRQ
jgi:pilus assembly protein CpaE